MMILRKAIESDLPELSRVCSETFETTYKGKGKNRPDEMVHTYCRETFDPKLLKKELEDSRVTTYVGTIDEKIVGYFKLIDEPPPEFVSEKNLAHLERIYLLKEFHGKGLGKKLLSKSEESARNLGRSGIWLGVWDENQEAIRFYLSQGYTKVGSHSWTFDYKGHHYEDTDDVLVKMF